MYKYLNLILVGMSFLGVSFSTYAGELENRRCQAAIPDPEAISLYNILMPGAPHEWVNVCGSYLGGDGQGGEAGGNWLNMYFIVSTVEAPDAVVKTYLHHYQLHTAIASAIDGTKIASQWAYADDSGRMNSVLFFTRTVSPEGEVTKVTMDYIDTHNVYRAREIVGAELLALQPLE
jgi:hypothetical protein